MKGPVIRAVFVHYPPVRTFAYTDSDDVPVGAHHFTHFEAVKN
jgi:hypothetical protein